nr:glycosyltransferase [Microbacterium bovistercoris]
MTVVSRSEAASNPHLAAPRYSIVSAVYNVGRYLDDFIASIERQDLDLSLIEVIAVDDGSTDDSLARLKMWADQSALRVIVVTQENAGQGAARNNGMQHVTGEWVTFPDPDDWLEGDYFTKVDQFLEDNPETSMVATSRLTFLEGRDSEPKHGHPLRDFFTDDYLADISIRADRFHGSAPAAFFRHAVLQENDIRFDLRIRPNFEDGHFCCHYLLTREQPTIGFLGSAHYIYRKREDGSSTLQTKSLSPEHFIDVPRHGYLEVLQYAREVTGLVPGWLQNFVLYELSWYFQEDMAIGNAPTVALGEVGAEFVDLLGQIATYLEPWRIDAFDIRRFDREWRDILMHGVFVEPWHTDYAVVNQIDTDRRAFLLSYRYVGAAPQERVIADAAPTTPISSKNRSVEYFGQTVLVERLLWVAATDSAFVELDGRAVEMRNSSPGAVRMVARMRPMAPKPRRSLRQRVALERRIVLAAADSDYARRRYTNAWTFMDRIADADDNAERLFRWVRTVHPEVNAWFVLHRSSLDWARLVKDGFGDRLVAHGSWKWTMLLANTRHFISSHIDRSHQVPQPLSRFRKPTWKYTFLQHGVIKDDLSRWLNRKTISLFVTSTPGEHASIVADGSPYRFTERDVKMTGLPRFDKLLERGSEFSPGQRDLILVAPTWRNWLNIKPSEGQARGQVIGDFMQTEYARHWFAVLSSPRLRDLAQAHGKRVGFLPHPNMQPILSAMDLPDHVQPLTYEGQDVQGYFARAATLLTDYSSVAFNAAYIDRPVVYFQFDFEAAMHGGHLGREGYFDYRRDGFGPVCITDEQVDTAVAEIAAHGWTPPPAFQERIDRTFPQRDGQSCRRTFEAIVALEGPTQ